MTESTSGQSRRSLPALALSIALSAVAGSARASDPGYYVVTAYDNAGIHSIDTRYWTVKFPGQPAILWPEVGTGYGVNSRWYTELYASWVGISGEAKKLSTLNWQNEVLLTQGEWPIDVALHGSLIRSVLAGQEETVVEFGPALQTDIDRTQLNANFFVQREWGDGRSDRLQLRYQWQVKRKLVPLLAVGLQGFGEVGPWDRWLARGDQSHRAGPAVFGTWRFGGDRALLYQAAYLYGSVLGVDRTRMFTARVQLTF